MFVTWSVRHMCVAASKSPGRRRTDESRKQEKLIKGREEAFGADTLSPPMARCQAFDLRMSTWDEMTSEMLLPPR